VPRTSRLWAQLDGTHKTKWHQGKEFSDPTARVQGSKLWEEDIFHKNREISILTMKKKQQG